VNQPTQTPEPAAMSVPPTAVRPGWQILVLTDSLAFHGPGLGELTTEPRLWPNVLAAELGAQATIYGRRGWTARDAWFALTKDPYVYSVLLPRADAVILAVGGMDYLPAVLPSHLREGIRLLRPPAVRRLATRSLRAAQPIGARLLRGRWRSLSQASTDHYLTRCVDGIRHFHPSTPVFGTVPPPHDAPGYGRVTAGHAGAVAAALGWGRRHQVPMLRFDEWVAPFIGAADMNVDGLHWGWRCHDAVGRRAASVLGGG
jgi:hypothetical protein